MNFVASTHPTTQAGATGDRASQDLVDFFDHAAVALHLVGPDGIIIRANQAELDLLGYEPEEYIGRHIAEFHADREVIDSILDRLTSGEELREFPARLRCKDGSLKKVAISSNALREAGRLVHTRCFTRDLTEQDAAEQALRERQTWLAGQSQALEAALNGLPLESSLGTLALTAVELLGPEVRAAFYLANAEGTALHHVVGMDPAYAEAIDGFPIGPESLSCGLAVHTGQPILTSDVTAEPLWGPWLWLADQHVFRGCWSIPVHTSVSRYSGTLALYWREPHAASPRELEIVGQLSQAAGIIVSRHFEMQERRTAEEALRLSERRLQQELRDMQILQAISAEMVQEEDFASLYAKIVDAASGVMGSDFASMQMLYPERGTGGELLLLSAKGFAPDALRFWKWVRADSSSACGQALRSGARVIEHDVANSSVMAGTPDQRALLDSGIRAVQTTPLFSRDGRVLGMISTQWRQPHRPQERELRLLDVLARQAADLIERKLAEEQRRKQSERVRLLWETAETLLSADQPDAMLRALFDRIGPQLGVDVYFNYVVDETCGGLRLASCGGVAPDVAEQVERIDFGQAVCGTVALRRSAVVVANVHESDDAMTQCVRSMGIRAYACNPLIAKERLLGTLSFGSRSKDALDADEVGFLGTVCHYVTTAYERLRLLDQLKESDRRKDEFLATLAHELRNPLAPIRNAAQALRLKAPAEADLVSSCELLERQVGHMTRLIDDLLDVARVTSNKLELRRQRLPLAEVIQAALQSSSAMVAECGHELSVKLPPEPVYVDADAVRLAQVFLNLITNAAKYTPRGGAIRIAAERHDGEVAVSVKDSGIGIAADKLPRLFEMFFQADRSLEKTQGGLGIGLSLVRQLVHLHGGRVEARSEGAGKGSEFVVRLPVVDAPKSHSPPLRADDLFIAPGGHRILVVDDHRDAADSLADLLRMAGNEVHTAYDGAAGVEAVERLAPGIVLMDIGMPRLNGYDACRQIRSSPWYRGAVLIALTGWGQDEDRLRSKEAGFDGHLVKPVDPVALAELIARVPAAQPV